MAIKKCKGTGKAKGYGCGSELRYSENNGMKTYKAKYGLGLSCCYTKWLSSSEEGKKLIQRATLSGKKKIEKKTKSEKFQKNRKWKKENKSLRALQNDARKVFQRFIRLRDEYENCISCGTIYANEWDGGHYLKAEIYSGLVFDEVNVNKQCDSCNRFQDGNVVEYRKGLVRKYSEVTVLELEKNSNYRRGYKYTRQELLGIEKLYKLKIKNLNNAEMGFERVNVSEEKKQEIVNFFKTNFNNTMPILAKRFGYSTYTVNRIITEYYSSLKQARKCDTH